MSTSAVGVSEGERRTIIRGVLLAMFLAALDQTIVAPALPTIGSALGDVSHLSWVVTAYLLAATAVTPLYGKLADIHGRRVVLTAGITIFMVGSVLCAIAPTILTLALARAVQGLGGGGLIALAQIIIGDVVSPRERSRYQAFIASVFATASIAGPVLGGFFAEYLHWSAIFWINLPLGVLAIAIMSRALRNLPQHHRRHRLDLVGAVLIVITTLLLLLALNWGGSRFPWTSPEILALLAGFVLLTGYFLWRLPRVPEPLLPIDVLRDRVVALGTCGGSFAMGAFVGLAVYVPLYFELVLGLSASQAGLALIALMIGTPIGATASGHSMARVQHYKRLALAGATLAVIALGVLAWGTPGLPLAAVELLFVLTGIGIGAVFPVTTVSVQNAVDIRHLGIATGVLNLFRQLGSAMGVAIFGAILLGGAVRGGASGGAGLGHGVPVSDLSGVDLGGMFGYVFLAAAVCLALSFLCVLVMEERPLRSTVAPVSGSAGS